MKEYFILTALANVILNYIILNEYKHQSFITYAENKGALKFYLVSALTGWFAIPIIFIYTIKKLYMRK